jgi:hypothetical protein
MPDHAQDGQDRRTEPRALTASLIDIVDEWNDASQCILEDLSSSGACIHADIPLHVGAKVTLRAGCIAQVAIVKHCRSALGGFDIGLEFVGRRWPSPIQIPIHWIHVDRS